MSVLEFHTLITLPPSMVNRDDQGMPKTAPYGGVLRSRISSQALKHSWRTAMRERGLLPPDYLADRTRTLVGLLATALVDRGHTSQEAELLAVNVVWGMELLDTDPKNAAARQTSTLLFLAPGDVAAIADAVHAHAADVLPHTKALDAVWGPPPGSEENPTASASKVARKAACPKPLATFAKSLFKSLDARRAADIALFGRMLAEAPTARVDGALDVAHSLGITEFSLTLDYYTACDDVTGIAGYLDTTYLTSDTHYLYACVDLGLLAANLAGDEQLAQNALHALMTAMLSAMPHGKHTSTAPHVRPDLFLAQLRRGQPLSLAGAFLAAPRLRPGQDPVCVAVDALTAHQARLAGAYGDSDILATWHLFTGSPTDLARPVPGETLTAADLAARAAARAVLHLDDQAGAQ